MSPRFFLAGVWPDVSLKIDILLFCAVACDALKRLATGASLGGTEEDGGSFAILISAFVKPGGMIHGEPGGGVEFAMAVILRFFVSRRSLFFEMRAGRAGKIRSDQKNCN